MKAIHQFVVSFSRYDAVGNHALRLRELLRDLGVCSEIYALEGGARHASEALPASRFATRGHPTDTTLVYQLATGSGLATWLRERPEPVVINYHNITPSRYFDAWSLETAATVAAGRRQLYALAPKAVAGVAVSAYNEAELVDAGYRATAVAPVLFDVEDPAAANPGTQAVDSQVATRLAATKRGLDVLFVGRIAPNKAQHDLVKALAAYRRLYDPQARLHLVGGMAVPRYQTALEGFVGALGLGDAVTFTGHVSAAALAAHYRNADVFVCLSDHEGFCVPVLEAMHHGLPVIAYAAAAVPETLAGAGLLLADKSPINVAAAIRTVVSRARVRDALVAAGRRRLDDLSPGRTRARYMELFEGLLDGQLGSPGVSREAAHPELYQGFG